MGAYRGAWKGLPLSLLVWGILIAGWTTGAFGQSVQQSGTVTPNTAAIWNSTGVIKGGVTATDSPLTTFGVTRDAVDAFCVSSARQTAVGRNQLCFQAATSGNAKISLQNYGTATPRGLDFVINGTTVTIPSTGGDQVALENGPFGANDVACFVNSSGVLHDCGMTISGGVVTAGTWQGTPVALGFGGTGGTSAATARTNLGLGTMATQATSAVAITGGAITGMSSPTIGSDVANKTYVDATSSGLHILPQSLLATAAVLPNTPTYSNGASGVGATLTAGTNTTLTVDGTAAPLSTVVLVKNQASAFQNGIYTVTTAGSGAAAWVLTRATYFDVAAEMTAGSYTFISGGATNINTSYTLQTAVTTVGTDALTFVQFSAASGGTVTSATIASGTGISVSGTCTITSSGTCTVNNTGVTSVATDGATGITGGTITTTGTVSCSQGSSTQFGCVKVDGTSLLASSGVASVNTAQLAGVVPTTSTVTITIASPGVVTWTSHNLAANTPVYFCTTLTLPTGLTACTPAVGLTYGNQYVSNPTLYYVVGSSITVNTFQVATSVANAIAGVSVNTSGSQSGTHTAFANAFACAGCIGEVIFKTTPITNPNVTSGADTIFNTVTLTPGVWKISGNSGVYGTSGSSVFSTNHSTYGIGATTISTVPYNGSVAAHVTSNQSNGWIWPFTETTIQVYATASLNAVCQPYFTGGTATCYGYLQAERER